MRFQDENYVRLFVRDTPTWTMLPWQGRACLPLILRKLDRAGILELGKYGYEGLAATIGLPLEVVTAGMAALLKQKVLLYRKSTGLLHWPRFREAQEAATSDKARKARQRESDAARARAEALGLEPPRRLQRTPRKPVTKRDASSQNVTSGHTRSRGVTLNSPVQISAVPKRERAGARARTLSRGPITIDRQMSMPVACLAIFEERIAQRMPRPSGVTCERAWRSFASKHAGHAFPNEEAFHGKWSNWIDVERGTQPPARCVGNEQQFQQPSNPANVGREPESVDFVAALAQAQSS